MENDRLKCKKLLLAIFFIFYFLFFMRSLATASFEDKPVSARAGAMAGSFVAVSNDASSPFFNPAGLNLFNAVNLSFSQVSLYSESDLAYSDIGISFPTRRLGSFAINSTSFGKSFYKESELIFTHSFLLAPGAYLGYNIRSLGLKIEGAGSDSAVAFDWGIYGSVNPKFSFGLFSKGLNRPKIANEDVYRQLSGGICWRPFGGLLASFEVDSPSDRDENVIKLGCELNVLPSFCVRFGVQPSPQVAAFGFGFMFKFMDIDYAYISHGTLFPEHLFTLSLRWGEKREIAAPTQFYKKAKKKRRKVKFEKPSAGRETTLEKVNINEADTKELDSLPGIGRVTAMRIVEYRQAHGKFRKIEDILDVPRFRKSQFEKIKDYITVGEVSQPEIAPEEEMPAPRSKKKKKEKMSPEKMNMLKKKYYFEGLKLYQAGKYKKAIKVFRKILELDPTHPQSIRIIKKCEDALENR